MLAGIRPRDLEDRAVELGEEHEDLKAAAQALDGLITQIEGVSWLIGRYAFGLLALCSDWLERL